VVSSGTLFKNEWIINK
jgi:hypothetical protein